MREWSELDMSFTAGGFLSPSDAFCSAEQQLQYYGESILLPVSCCGFAAPHPPTTPPPPLLL